MKIAIIALLALLGGVFAQDEFEGEFEGDEVDPSASVSASVEWEKNEREAGGALVDFAYADIGEGSCTVELPEPVLLFHVMNGHIVTGEGTKPVEGTYKIAAPAGWEAINGTIRALILYDEVFNVTDIEFRCDPSDIEELSVYSFPQNALQKEASSNVHYRPGYHKGDVLTITLPNDVKRFNITGADSELVIDNQGLTYTVSGFKNEEGIDDQKEVHFSLEYLDPADEDDSSNWFSAGDVTVSLTQEEPEEEDPEF